MDLTQTLLIMYIAKTKKKIVFFLDLYLHLPVWPVYVLVEIKFT